MALVENRKARLNYEFLEELEAGIELVGFEVKSLKKNQGSLEGSYVLIRGGEAFLTGAYIPPYQQNNTPKDYDPYRTRRLLLSKKEIINLHHSGETAGLTIVPISWYLKGNKVKLSIAIARGKKKYDKRASVKKRETDRDIDRTLKYS